VSLSRRARARVPLLVLLAGALAALPVATLRAAPAAAEARIDALEAEVATLRAHLERLEARLAAEQAPATPVIEERLLATPVAEDEPAPAGGGLRSGAEAADDLVLAGAADAPPDPIRIGGALRFTGLAQEGRDATETQYGEAGLDVFRLNVDGRIGEIALSAEYRHYPFMDTIRHGWIGWSPDDDTAIEAGVTRVPFGLLPYASHSFWFGTTYYAGFEDDHDLGVKIVREAGPWTVHGAYFKGDELGDATDLDRYAFDLVRDGGAALEESNRVNGRVAYTVGRNTTCQHEIGVSGQFGQVLDEPRDRQERAWAAAVHLDSRCGRWNVQLQGLRYDVDAPRRENGGRVVRLGAFGSAYDAAAAADIWTVNVARSLDVDHPWVDSLLCYNDYSVMDKDAGGFDDSVLNTTGCLVETGPLYTYVDLIHGDNAAFLGGSLAGDGDDGWTRRINLNVGYYW
jgi:outer membrane murein-binding lipoprotein Lpp